MSSSPRVDVVVVTYDPGDTIAVFLESTVLQADVASVTVVDNASQDGAAQAAAATSGVGFVDTGRNAGYGFAANRGAEQGSAPWVLVSNADIEIKPGALAAMADAGDADPSIGVVGPVVRETDGSVYPSARPLPTFWLGTGHALLGRVWTNNPFSRAYRAPLDVEGGPVDAGWLSGSCFLARREAWEAIGGFDEGFFMFFEDVDLGRRMGEAGYRNVWVPTAEVIHLGGHSYRSDPTPMLAAHHASAARYLGLVYPHWWQRPGRALMEWGLAARHKAEVAVARKRLASRAD